VVTFTFKLLEQLLQKKLVRVVGSTEN